MILFHKRSRPFNQIQILFILSFKHLSSWDYLKKKKKKKHSQSRRRKAFIQRRKVVYPVTSTWRKERPWTRLGRKYSAQRMQQARQGLACCVYTSIYLYKSIYNGRPVGRSAPGSNRSDDFPASESIPFFVCFSFPRAWRSTGLESGQLSAFRPPPSPTCPFFHPFPLLPTHGTTTEGRRKLRALYRPCSLRAHVPGGS